jgi:glycosyltransferase involved in cell wall biosynthesis
MKVSVVIPTYNREKKVLQTLKALQYQQYDDFEIIVVVDGSVDNTAATLNSYQSIHPLKVISQPNRGRAGARNSGVKFSQGEILVFYDDDVVPAADSIVMHAKFHELHPGVAILAGNPAEYVEKRKTDFQNYKAFLCERWLSPYKKGLNELGYDNLFLAGANFSMKKEAFVRLSGFSETLRDNEDYDIAYRAMDNGLAVWFDFNNIAIHDDPITCSSYIHRLQQYTISHSGDYLLYPKGNKKKCSTLKPGRMKMLMYWIFSWKFWVEVVDGFNFLLMLPKRLRYKLYDVITFSQSEFFVRK